MGHTYYAFLVLLILTATNLSHIGAVQAGKDAVITIGGSLSTLPSDANRAITGLGIKRGLETFAEWANAQGGLRVNGTAYSFAVHILEDNSDRDTMLQNYRQIIANNSIDLIVGPVASDFTLSAALEVTEPAKRLLIGFAVIEFAHNSAKILIFPFISTTQKAEFSHRCAQRLATTRRSSLFERSGF